MHRTICDFTLDIIHNAIEAGSSLILVDFIESRDELKVFVADNGLGMSEERLREVRDPFSTDGTKHQDRKVGLGLAFTSQAVEMAGGDFEIDSRPDHGNSVMIRFPLAHIDTPPIGELAETLLAAFSYPGDFEMVVNRRLPDSGGEYSLVRSELAEALGGFETSGALRLLRKYLDSQEILAVPANKEGSV
ncbi:MAG TPA: ATP-binding protein [Sediminispirochaeta sp.]|nr:ATP-binding protein [Sediminispirochaeta sp.]